jgi:hypothetical protein
LLRAAVPLAALLLTKQPPVIETLALSVSRPPPERLAVLYPRDTCDPVIEAVLET